LPPHGGAGRRAGPSAPVPRRGPADQGAPGSRSPHDPHHRGPRLLRPAAGTPVRRRADGSPRPPRGPVHRPAVLTSGGGRGTGRMAPLLRGGARRGSQGFVRLRGQPLRPAASAGGREPRGRQPGRGAVSGGPQAPVARGTLETLERHAARVAPGRESLVAGDRAVPFGGPLPRGQGPWRAPP